ncbi:Hypothetical predicted protein [Mytilus galloprovincialis]|uniref:Uncharacterized protein n=1 Tax=Mytilus galloprovincialis TaxID=29158 RepID=A0A8B6EMZ5_MYTGA|nr:Hypothetical predicted protein [Mytilus galloprovincialis]
MKKYIAYNRLEITDLKNRLHDLELEQEKIYHTVEIDLTKHSKFGRYTYTAETDLCIMELLNCHVPVDRDDTVIKSVFSLCNLKAKDETLPKKDYVSSVNVRRLAISQAHIAETCIEENRTLYTDETRKNGQSYGVFITSNENQEPCLMGLKHMSSKASKTELETLKEILKEIEDRTQYLQNENPPSSAYNILKDISNTMSDREATEKSFQQLLQDYRTTLLKENIDNFYQNQTNY